MAELLASLSGDEQQELIRILETLHEALRLEGISCLSPALPVHLGPVVLPLLLDVLDLIYQ